MARLNLRAHPALRRLLVVVATVLPGCSDTPTGLRAVVFDASLGVNLDTFVETSSGLFYKDEVVGSGAEAQVGSFVNFEVEGWYADGTQFQPREALANQKLDQSELVPGVDEALRGMRVGGERLAVVPPHLGYGQGLVLVFRLFLTGVN